MDDKEFVIIKMRKPQGIDKEYGVIYTCPSCNEHILEKFNFCPKCGKAIYWMVTSE